MINNRLILSLLFLFLFASVDLAFADSVFIVQSPETCYKVDKIKDNNVYLTVNKNIACSNILTPIPVKLSKSYGEINVYIDGKFYQTQKPTISTSQLDNIQQQALESAKNIKLQKNPYQNEMNALAKNTYEYYQKYVEPQVQQYKNNFINNEFSQYIPQNIINQYNKQNNLVKQVKKLGSGHYIDLHLTNSQQLFLCISSSMPDYVTRNYIKLISEYFHGQITVVLKGFIGGVTYISPTVNYIFKLIQKDPQCNPTSMQCKYYRAAIEVDPFIFDRFGINEVPALVYVDGIHFDGTHMSVGLPQFTQIKNFYVFFGDISMGYALKEIGKASGNKNLVAGGEEFMALNQ